MANEQKFLEWTYPVAGIDRQEEFQEQPALTTPVAKNVRAFEPSSDRGRGGSRPGISRYLPQLPEDEEVIQHLRIIVDPQGPLTGLSFGPEGTTTLDTSDGDRNKLDDGSTRIIRVGGSGFYTHPEADQEEDDGSSVVELIQAKANFFGSSSSAQEIEFDDDVASQSIVIVVVGQLTVGSGAGVTVTNDAGDAYTRIGAGGADDGYAIAMDGANEFRCSVWWKQVSGGSVPDKTVRVTLGGTTFLTIYGSEWRNLDVSTPVRDFAISALDRPSDVTLTLPLSPPPPPPPPPPPAAPGPFNEAVDYTAKDLVFRVYRELSSTSGPGYVISAFNGSYTLVVANPGGTFQGSLHYATNAEESSEPFTLTHGTPTVSVGADDDTWNYRYRYSGYVFIAASLQWSGA